MLDIQVSLNLEEKNGINLLKSTNISTHHDHSFKLLHCSTTGALEAAYSQAFGKPISLSEQQLVDCARAFNNFGCNGGLPSQAFEYVKYNGGIETEEAYPYTGVDGECKFASENVAVQVHDSVNITLVRIVSIFSRFFLH